MRKLTMPISAILGLAAMLVANPISAQSSAAMSASMPFEFSVGKTVLPAGEYTVKLDYVSSGVLLIQGKDNGRSAMILTDTAYANKAMNDSLLVFHRYGNQYFLSKVWTAGSDIGCELRKTPAEREISRAYRLAKNDEQVQTVTLAAYRQ